MGSRELNLGGVRILPGHLEPAGQAAVLDALRGVVAVAPLFRPVTAHGQTLSVRMTSAGRVGWISDRLGYRYASRHPDGRAWPAIPARLLALWRDVVDTDQDPDTCLINFYDQDARMGLHQDRDEADLTHPVVSLSLGDDALFRVGGVERGGPSESLWLRSGDVAVLAGLSRLSYHGVDRIRFGSSQLLSHGGRLNVTLRIAQ